MVGGQKFFERKEIRDLIAYLRFLINPFDSISLLRIINVPRRGIGDTTVEKLQAVATQKGQSLWESLCDAQNAGLPKRTADKLLEFANDMIRLMGTVAAVDAGELCAYRYRKLRIAGAIRAGRID